ncbi:hypothetical protein BD410DRAFT_795415 [Rickenella mellea]|uniref:Uncharacterized protein n=1 Tax=Rickenella mellea TaxID=50990 RepID=A0A4Y7PLX2_9AGAM|nr:hypothetical protein BD410DRAFT_795415 [Rickenella mellea]
MEVKLDEKTHHRASPTSPTQRAPHYANQSDKKRMSTLRPPNTAPSRQSRVSKNLSDSPTTSQKC